MATKGNKTRKKIFFAFVQGNKLSLDWIDTIFVSGIQFLYSTPVVGLNYGQGPTTLFWGGDAASNPVKQIQLQNCAANKERIEKTSAFWETLMFEVKQ